MFHSTLLHGCIKRGLGKLTKFACKHSFIQYLHFPTENTWRISEDFRTFDNCWPSPDVEYEEPGGLQEKLERLNAIMSTEWAASSANYGRRMQYLSNCEYITYLFRLVSLWFFWNSSFGWLCILGILEWFFLNKHYHGHNFRPLPPQSLPPSLISYLRESSCLLSQKYQALRSNNMQNCIFARTSATWFYWKWKFTITTTSQVITKI